jgi:hypothetical protein
MNYLSIFIAMLLYAHHCTAQNNAAGDLIPNEFDFFLYAQQMANKPSKQLYLNQLNDYSNIEGSPFWFDDELVAQVVQNNGDKINNVPILFDQYRHEILAKTKEKGIILLDEALYHKIVINRGVEKDIFTKAHPAYPNDFFMILYEDDSFIVFKGLEVQLNESASSYVGINDKIREFRRKTKYFLQTDGDILELNFKKKKFFDSFSKEETQIMKTFAKKEKIKMKSESDYLQMIQHLLGR